MQSRKKKHLEKLTIQKEKSQIFRPDRTIKVKCLRLFQQFALLQPYRVLLIDVTAHS
jgi:hypothetical protein